MQDTGERLIEKGNEQTLTYGEHLSRYNSVLNIVKDKVVLDIASGSGYGTKLMSKNAKRVIGVDYSKDAIRYAKTHYKADNITYLTGDAHQLPVEEKSIDVVISFETIEHLDKPDKFLQEVKRVLKRNGIFVVSTPNDSEFMEGNEFHVHEFDLSELKKLINKNFTSCEFYYQGTWFGAGLLSGRRFEQTIPTRNLEITKTFGQRHHKAIFFIAVASNGPIPALQENIVIADSWSGKENLEREKVRKATIESLEDKTEKLKQKCDKLGEQLAYIHSTRWWKARHAAGRIRSRTKAQFNRENKRRA